jgi:hypothetical protein
MAMQKINMITILAVTMTVIVVSVLAASLLVAYQRVPNSGNVKGVGVSVYWDSSCTNNVTSIDWGFLEPGTTTNVTVYIRNEGSIPVVLNMTTDNWNPTFASNNMTLSWNREGYVLNTTVSTVQTVLTLSVSPSINGVTNFTFDIVITGTEYT